VRNDLKEGDSGQEGEKGARTLGAQCEREIGKKRGLLMMHNFKGQVAQILSQNGIPGKGRAGSGLNIVSRDGGGREVSVFE